MAEYDSFELHRLIDGLVYQFDRAQRADGVIGYRRSDMNVWIVRRPDVGWVAYDEDTQRITGRSWETLPTEQGDHPPAGIWVSRKGAKAYVYDLIYRP